MGWPAQIFTTAPQTGSVLRARQAPAQLVAVPVAVIATPSGTVSSAHSTSARARGGRDHRQASNAPVKIANLDGLINLSPSSLIDLWLLAKLEVSAKESHRGLSPELGSSKRARSPPLVVH
ncbi:MAG: hypothetical protein ACREQT_17765 [Candidatus Binataceae bacterium]